MSGRSRWLLVLSIILGATLVASGQEEKKPPKKAPAGASSKAETKKASAEGEKGEAGPAGEAPEPQFRSEKGAEAFQKAKDLFDLEKYSEARDEMKRARELGKTPGDRALVEKWVGACEAGIHLEGYRRLAERGIVRKTFFAALESAEHAKGTAIAPRFAEFVEGLRSKALEVLDNFDNPSKRYSEAFGKRFIDNPAIVFRGSHCLEWTSAKSGKVSQLKLPSVPQKWTPYQSVVFWIRFERPVELKLLALSPGAVAAGQDPNVMEGSFSPPGRPGWVRAEVDLDKFKRHGNATFANVEAFLIQIDSKTTYKLYLDDVALVKKDSAEVRATPDSKDDKDQKKSKKQKTATGKIKQTERNQ
jgi:hypothetical protein